jgi:CheY-like chemotaxis protein
MPDGGVITIAGKNIEVDEAGPLSRGRYVRLSVHDQGYGIPKAIRNRIFDPYFTTKERGSGLGLATVYSIVRRHGGNITLASEEGKGTTFFVYLPAAGDRAPDRETEPAATGEAVACMPCRILVVDDEQPILNTVRVILEHFGYRVETARTGNEALELYQAAREQGQGFDTVLLDLTIPGGMGGKQIMAALLTLDPKVKAIVSSGYSDDPLMTDFRRYGFKEAATKPYRAEDLAETIRRVLTSE